MSRIGKKPIQIPVGVTVTEENGMFTVKGPKGEVSRRFHASIQVTQSSGAALVDVKHKDDRFERALWGTFASHLSNMIEGVSRGFQKQLEVNGVGYRVAAQGADLKLELGFSHPVIFQMPSGVKAAIEKNVITLSGIDKEAVGKAAAELRALRPPEPYKGKGIKYMDELIRRKAGKAAKAAGA